MRFGRVLGIQQYAIHSICLLETAGSSTILALISAASRKDLITKRSERSASRCRACLVLRTLCKGNHVASFRLVRRVSAICLTATMILSGLYATASTRRGKPERRTVVFLATGSLVRGTVGYNEDTYLAEFVPASGNDRMIIRLVDDYPNYAPPLSAEVLTSGTGTALKVKRDKECDVPYFAMPLRTAPGDPMAIIPEKLSFRPKLDPPIDLTTVLECYRVVRR